MSTQEYMCQAVFLKVSSEKKKKKGHLGVPLKILNPGGRAARLAGNIPSLVLLDEWKTDLNNVLTSNCP